MRPIGSRLGSTGALNFVSEVMLLASHQIRLLNKFVLNDMLSGRYCTAHHDWDVTGYQGLLCP